MAKKREKGRRVYDREFKEHAVQMLLDGQSAATVVTNLGLSGSNLLYRWKAQFMKVSGVAAQTLESRVRELEDQLRRVERERDV